MASTYSRNEKLELMATGDQPGTWGLTTNENFGYIEDAIDGIVEVPVGAGGTLPMDISDAAPSDARHKVLRFTGTPSSDVTVFFEADDARKVYFVVNEITNDHTITFRQSVGGESYTLDAGYAAVIDCNGDGTEANCRGTLANLQVMRLLVKTDMTVEGETTYTGDTEFTGDITLDADLTVLAGHTVTFNSPVDVTV